MDLDKELREALTRKRAPAGFAGRVMARVDPPRRRMAWAWPAALAASMFVGVVGVERFERIRAERASEELRLALEITASKIDLADRKANEVLQQ